MKGGVLIVAGGTGGHVFPALAVADTLVRDRMPVTWLGTPRGLEARVVPAAGHQLECVRVRGLRGNGLAGWLLAPLMITRALIEALVIIRRHRPSVMLGMGGYVAGPAGLAAWLSRVPLVIHEQNAIAGLTNRLLCRLASRVLTGLNAPMNTRTPVEFVGNPVRAAIAEVPPPALRYRTRKGPARILVIGGSLGALTLNRRVPEALALIPEAERPQVLHQAGSKTLEQARRAYTEAGVEADVCEFIDDMGKAYAECDLVICRSGALTVSELAAAGVPAILVPYPHAVDDHQSANAAFLTSVGAAEQRADAELSAEWLAQRLQHLLADRQRLQTMAEAARDLGRPSAAERVAQICREVGV